MMSKKDLIRDISESTGLTQGDVTKVIDAMPEAFRKELADSKRATIPGIAILTVKTRKARIGRNPKTGEEINIPEKEVVAFKAAKGFFQ